MQMGYLREKCEEEDRLLHQQQQVRLNLTTLNIFSHIKLSYSSCVCKEGTECRVSEENLSMAAFIHRCVTIPSHSATTFATSTVTEEET
jgi:hypothetical protein